MYYNSITPFLDMSFINKIKSEQVKVSDIYCPLEGGPDVTTMQVAIPEVVKIMHIEPLGLRVFCESDTLSWYLKNAHFEDTINSSVYYVDYGRVAALIDYDEQNGIASIPINGSFLEIEGVLNGTFISSANSGISLSEEMLNNLGMDVRIKMRDRMKITDLIDSKIHEAASFTDAMNAFTSKSGKLDVGKGNVTVKSDDVERYLSAYLDSPPKLDEMVPLLLGPSAVFKSATVKSLCKQKGMRMVDFRAAFTSRVDYLGLIQRVPDEEGNRFSYNCPMEPLYVCSDGFKQYCQESLDEIEKALADGFLTEESGSDGSKVTNQVPIDAESKQKLEELVEKYKEFLKPTVIFFDEVTRCTDTGVQNVLTVILNQKMLGEMKFLGCKFVAASNSALGDNVLDMVYQVDNEVDAAYARRFLPIEVTPEAVRGRWFDWAGQDKVLKDYKGNDITDDQGNQIVQKNIHPDVLKYLNKNPENSYSTADIYKTWNRTMSADEAAAQPYANYRTWELVSNYIYAREAKKSIFKDTITGLIGPTIGDSLCEYLKANGYTVSSYDDVTAANPDADKMSTFIDECFETNTPALLIGPSSLGKTSRVKKYVDKGWLYLPVNLSTLERTDLTGTPTKVNAANYVATGIKQNKSMKVLGKKLDSIMDNICASDEYGMSPYLTINAPNLDVAKKFKLAVETNRPVILFFDECNRVTNPAIMSAMFEAISDNRIFGVSFDPRYVKVIAACNYGVEYKNANAIDSALAARFSIFRKDAYDESDVKSFIDYLKRESKPGGDADHKILINYLEDVVKTTGYGPLVEMFKQVESENIEAGVPSTRAMSQLSAHLTSLSKSPIFNGSVAFCTPDMENMVIDIHDLSMNTTDAGTVQGNFNYLKSATEKVLDQVTIDGWAPAKMDEKIKLPNGSIAPSDLVEFLQAGYKEVLCDPNAMASLGTKEGLAKMNNNLKVIASTILNMQQIDSMVADSRINQFSYYLGKVAADSFGKFFNIHFGNDVETITIEMLDDIKKVRPYVVQRLTVHVNGAGKEMWEEALQMYKDIFDYWKDKNLKSDNYAEMLRVTVGNIKQVGTEPVKKMLLGMGTDGLDLLIADAEKIGDDFIKYLVSESGFTISQDRIDEIRNSMSGTTASKSKARLL